MKLLQSMIVALGMYSKIPMPKIEWNKDNMKYALCFFPLVGIITGVISCFIMNICDSLNLGTLIIAVFMTVIPIFVTGGIHMDGYIDTVDAISSYGDKEKRLNVLKDPHCGAFAIIFTIVYFLINTGVWTELNHDLTVFVVVSYVMSRTLSGFSVTTFKLAKNTGLAATFSDAAHKRNCRIVFVLQFIAEITILLALNPVFAVVIAVCELISFAYHYYVCMHYFGGITGDIAGYFLQICELVTLAGIMIAGKVVM